MNEDFTVKKLAWKCRRGMLELDIILLKFLKEQYSNLSKQEQQLFEQLLDEQDPVLADWLLGANKPADKDLASLISLIMHREVTGPICGANILKNRQGVNEPTGDRGRLFHASESDEID
jgi:antitoxin CptB